MRRLSYVIAALSVLGLGGAQIALALEGEPYAGAFRPPISNSYANPVDLDPETEDCTDGVDGDADGLIDWEDDDCQGDIGRQTLLLNQVGGTA